MNDVNEPGSAPRGSAGALGGPDPDLAAEALPGPDRALAPITSPKRLGLLIACTAGALFVWNAWRVTIAAARPACEVFSWLSLTTGTGFVMAVAAGLGCGWLLGRSTREVRPLNYAGPVAVFGAFLLGWWVWRNTILDEFKQRVIPSPETVLLQGFTRRGRPQNPCELIQGLRLTGQVALIGLMIAMTVGVAVAILMSRARWVENSLYPYAVAFQAVPIIAITPVIRILFGAGLMARTLVCVMIAVPPIILNTLFGLKSAEAGQHDLFTLHGASQVRRLLKLQLPASLPAMFEGFRISAGLSVIGAIVGEFFFRQGPRGLGILIDLYRQALAGPQLIADVFLCVLLGLVFFMTVGAIRTRVIGKWYQSAR